MQRMAVTCIHENDLRRATFELALFTVLTYNMYMKINAPFFCKKMLYEKVEFDCSKFRKAQYRSFET